MNGVKHIARIVGEDNLAKAFEDLYKTVVNLREYTREYNHRLGSEARRKKEYWEENLDKLIENIESGAYTPLHNNSVQAKEDYQKNSLK